MIGVNGNIYHRNRSVDFSVIYCASVKYRASYDTIANLEQKLFFFSNRVKELFELKDLRK